MRKKIIFVGALPPPLHGFSKINSEMLKLMKVDSDVTVINNASSNKNFLQEIISTFIMLFSVLSKILTIKYRVLYIGLNGGLRQLTDIFIISIANLLGLKIYIHHHSFAYINKVRFYNKVLFRIAKKNKHITLCTIMRNRLIELYGIADEDIIVLSNAAFLDNYSDKSQYRDENKSPTCIGFLSNITREKGIFIFFDVMDKLAENNIEFSAMIAGPIDVNIEKEFNERLNQHKSIQYLGPVYGSAKELFFRNISLLLFPTIYENEAEPVTIIEAFSCFVPVISFDRGCIRSLLNFNNGFVFKKEEYVNKTVGVIRNIKKNRTAFIEISINSHNAFLKIMKENNLVKRNLIKEICIEE